VDINNTLSNRDHQASGFTIEAAVPL